jgi:hypothetical protein
MTEGMVTIMAVFAQKKRLVKKLRAARDRKSIQQGRRIEGRKGYRETKPDPYARQSASYMATARNGFPSAPFRRDSMRWVTRPVRAAPYQPPKSNVSSMLREF